MSACYVLIRMAAALVLCLAGVESIDAAIFTVNSTADAVDANLGNAACATAAGVCTLRAAIQQANALAGADTINLPAGSYTLTRTGTGEDAAVTGDLDVTQNLTISGASAATTTIDANSIDRVLDVKGAANLTLSGVTFRGGNASGDGGGMASASGTQALTDVAVRNNTSSGKGGGIFNASGTLTLSRVTVSANSASSDGGGIYTDSSSVTLMLTNVTVSGNSTNSAGGGIFQSAATTTLTNVTIAGNSASSNGRQIHRNSGNITLKNTIISGASPPNCTGAMTSAGNNLGTANTCSFTGPGDQPNTNPNLGALADNGGQTQTHALLAGSPAIDAGTHTGAPATDQRGVARPQDGDGNGSSITDIGAYEVAGVAAVSVAGTVYLDANANGAPDGGEAGTGQTLFVKITPRSGAVCSGPATAAAAVNVGTGAYSLAGVTTGNYCLIVDGNATLSDITATTPAGYLFMTPTAGTLQITVAATPLTGQNFGLFNGSRLSGRVFRDTGVGGGVANNAVQDGSESGIANVAVSARNGSCAAGVCDSEVSNGAGDYVVFVPAIASGTVNILEINPAAFISTGGQPGSTGGAYTRATDTTAFAFAAGQSYSGVNFADVPENLFTTDGVAAGLRGSTVFYAHGFTAGSGGQVSFSLSNAASPAISGWNPLVYRDLNCNAALDGAEGASSLSAPIALVAGAQVCIVIKEFVPATAPDNATDLITVTANFNYSNASPALAAAYSHTDFTTVGAGLKLAETVRNVTSGGAVATSNQASPGHTLEYVIIYSNPGSEILRVIVISDATPAYTVFVSASCGVPLPANISACSVTTQPSVGTAGSVIWTLTGTLASGASGTVILRVTVQ